MLRAVNPEASTSSLPELDGDERIRQLNARVEQLQLEVAELRARHLRADERDAGLGSLPTEREALFREVERLANVGSWLWDVRTHEVAWSEQAFRIFGYDPAVDVATRDAFFAALHPDDRAILVGQSNRTAANGVAVERGRAHGRARQLELVGRDRPHRVVGYHVPHLRHHAGYADNAR